jgi:hypothetical protein
MKVSEGAITFWQRCLMKLTEKSSIVSYLTLFVTLFAKHYQGDVATVAAIISGTATILLFILSDAQVKAWLTGQK